MIDYLSNRFQYVKNLKSDNSSIEGGVPQGFILGPLLYLIYVNDIAQSSDAKILSIADDTSMCLSDSNIINLYERANIEAEILFHWFCANRLSLNPTSPSILSLETSPTMTS